jgi:RHS repeat-associated protein
VVTTASKGIQTRYYYDAWGKQTLASGTSITNRGYLAQEHLNDFGLINLNARLYDPILARFMGMDPYVQAADFTQAYNRYAYGLNNPLIYADPDGEFWWIVVGAIIGAYIGGSTAEGNLNPFKWNWDKNTWIGMGIGAGIGALGGWGFSVAAPALAQTSFFSHFGASGTVAAYSLTGTVTGGAIGYGAGFGTALYTSGGDWQYAHSRGKLMSGLGSQIGSAFGTLAGGWEVYQNYLQNKRPDEDRHLTLAEANDWYRNGNGESLDVDLEYFDLSRISPQDFSEIETSKIFNLLYPNYISSVNDGLVYGQIPLILHKGNYVTATYGFDTYDFEMHSWKTSFIRNIETIIGHAYAGWGGTPYQINIHGKKYLNNKKSK